MAQVIDWPDMDERGLWNFPEPDDWIPWLATLKLNYGKMASTQLHPIERGQRNRATIDREQFAAARQRAFNYLPYILHLTSCTTAAFSVTYPELAGKGDGALTGRYFAHKAGNQHRVPCASQPLLVQILQEWMEDIAGQGAEEISCWLSERPGSAAVLNALRWGSLCWRRGLLSRLGGRPKSAIPICRFASFYRPPPPCATIGCWTSCLRR